ncbi:hypothetical protein HOB10_01645 [Candidatus Parcubacteria bacterium]|jgi:hypothetical protein|nr:hypothetical protein [Candidatus Parcubacteria bacterium]
MPNPVLYIVFSVLGATIGHLILKKDKISTGLGIGIGLSIGFAITQASLWYLLGVPTFGFFLLQRRNKAK